MYVDAYLAKRKNEIRVVERINGERVYNTLTPEYVFYFEHAGGSHQTIFGDACKKYTTSDPQKFKRELDTYAGWRDPKKKRRIFESDINPIFRSLADHYRGAETPKLNIAFFDIETAYNADRGGYAPVGDPFNEITAISIYCKWVGRLITLALCPPTIDVDEARDMCGTFEDTYVFDDEKELLKTFMAVVDDADVLSGWNSSTYDIPYTINRIARLMGFDATRALCLWNERPRQRTIIKFKKEMETYDLVGRVHLDYLELYQKHNQQQLHSYKLDYVGEIEVGENKIPYEGNLDDLWKKDFIKFIAYNRQDTLLLDKIDEKCKFIELANQIAHSNCVLLKTTMGSVALVEQAITNEMHDMGFVVPDRKRTLEERGEIVVEDPEDDDEDDEEYEKAPVAGAYVADPKKGKHSHIGCCDINSLYPSAIRALNMSPETIVGQFRQDETKAYIEEKTKLLGKSKRAEAWAEIFASLEYSHIMAKDGAPLTFDYEDGTSKTMSARDWYDHIFDQRNKLCITANGTVFSTAKDGTIPMLLAKWYAERKQMQGREKDFEMILAGIDVSDKAASIESTAATDFRDDVSLGSLLKSGDFGAAKGFMEQHGLVLNGAKIVAKDDATRKTLKALEVFWNQRQQARKILLNSLYGALLNEALKFYDARLGQSTTLTGRMIDKHMNAYINEIITGSYDHKGDAIIAADTDSSYFSAYDYLKDKPGYEGVEWTRESIISLYDTIAEDTNASFPEFMQRSFNTSIARGSVIKAGREIVGSRGLFIKKKKYAILVYDKEGTRYDVDGKPGKLKVMGLDLKRADTPKYMQKFLEKLLISILTEEDEAKMFEDVKVFRRDFIGKPGWEKGTPKKVNALSDYKDRDEKAQNAAIDESYNKKNGKVAMPGHVRASLNWNTLCMLHQDRYSMRIGDGSKIIVCKLLPNSMKMDSVAYPIDEPHLPQWFKDLPFDEREMENTIIDKKLTNLVGVLKWDLNRTKDCDGDEFFVFD